MFPYSLPCTLRVRPYVGTRRKIARRLSAKPVAPADFGGRLGCWDDHETGVQTPTSNHDMEMGQVTLKFPHLFWGNIHRRVEDINVDIMRFFAQSVETQQCLAWLRVHSPTASEGWLIKREIPISFPMVGEHQEPCWWFWGFRDRLSCFVGASWDPWMGIAVF